MSATLDSLPGAPRTLTNREGHAGFDATWPGCSGVSPPGLSAVLRVRDESRNLPWVLPPLLSAVSEVVLIDNLSSDGTVSVASRLADSAGALERLRVESYPFPVSRCGWEHLHTPADSVHSLVHYYNWSFTRARRRHTLKWDGDMVLTHEGVSALRELIGWAEVREVVATWPHFPLYIENDRVAWFDRVRFAEPWVHPRSFEHSFVKAFDWEARRRAGKVAQVTMPEGLCFELKWLDRDELSHWSTSDFDARRTPRKARELSVTVAIRAGSADGVPALQRIEAPAGRHVVDHVATSWLPALPRPFGVKLSEVGPAG